MQPGRGAGKRYLPALVRGSIQEAGNQIDRKEGRVRSSSHDVRNLSASRPVKPRQDASQGTCMPGDRIGKDRQAELREPRLVAVGVQCQFAHLRRKPFDHVIQHRPVADGQKALVATAHAAGLAAGQYGA